MSQQRRLWSARLRAGVAGLVAALVIALAVSDASAACSVRASARNVEWGFTAKIVENRDHSVAGGAVTLATTERDTALGVVRTIQLPAGNARRLTCFVNDKGIAVKAVVTTTDGYVAFDRIRNTGIRGGSSRGKLTFVITARKGGGAYVDVYPEGPSVRGVPLESFRTSFDSGVEIAL